MNENGGRNKGEQEDMTISNPKTALPKESMRHYKTQSNPVLHFALGSGDSFANREHWIKTDADCKYINNSPQIDIP